ncbi:MAG: cytochrome c biogenesis protein CcdA [Phycisphaerae bacterium]
MLHALLLSLLLQAAPEFSAKLHADRTAVAPGETFAVVAEITVGDKWHVYHPLLLDTGLATKIKATLPDGVTLGPWQFPEPRLGEAAGIEYLALKSTFAVIADAKVSETFTGDNVQIDAEITALACIEQCVRVSTEASLKIPVGRDGAPANEDLFKKARRKLPQPLAKAEYLEKSEALVSHDQIPVGGSGEIVLKLQVRENHHIQDRNPLSEDFIASRLWIEKGAGVSIDEAKQLWPDPHVKEIQFLGKVREQSGTVMIRAPFTIDEEDATPGKVALQLLLQYQACKDDGECYMPMMATETVSFEIVSQNSPAVANAAYEKLDLSGEKKQTTAPPQSQPLYAIYFFAFLGGLILNIMPCVLPVISLKVFSFVNQAHESRGRVFALGLAFAAGVLISFLPIAILVARSGESWGTLLQTPAIVITLIAAVFAFGLSLLGVFEFQLPGRVQNVAGNASTREGFGGAFLNGVFATALATPCVGPFLGGALGALTTVPPLQAGIGIMFVGLGLAFPYLLLTAFPGWMKFMPKPGVWMETFKQFTGLIMMVVVVWLLWILFYLVEPSHFFAVMLFLVFVAAACWVIGRAGLTASWAKTLQAWLVAVWFLLCGWYGSKWWFAPSKYEHQWVNWEAGLPEKLANEGFTVYVDYTAKWCTTCQVNKGAVLNTKVIHELFAENNVVPMLADFTNFDDEIQKSLQSYERNGVPLNIIVPAGKPNEVIVMPEVLTTARVQEALEKAGKSTTEAKWQDANIAKNLEIASRSER